MSSTPMPASVPLWMYDHFVTVCRKHKQIPEDVRASKRQHQELLKEAALGLRRRNASWPEIAHTLGYRSHSGAYHLLNPTRKGLRT